MHALMCIRNYVLQTHEPLFYDTQRILFILSCFENLPLSVLGMPRLMVGIEGSSFSLKYSMFCVSFPHVSFTMDTETRIQENH